MKEKNSDHVSTHVYINKNLQSNAKMLSVSGLLLLLTALMIIRWPGGYSKPWIFSLKITIKSIYWKELHKWIWYINIPCVLSCIKVTVRSCRIIWISIAFSRNVAIFQTRHNIKKSPKLILIYCRAYDNIQLHLAFVTIISSIGVEIDFTGVHGIVQKCRVVLPTTLITSEAVVGVAATCTTAIRRHHVVIFMPTTWTVGRCAVRCARTTFWLSKYSPIFTSNTFIGQCGVCKSITI